LDFVTDNIAISGRNSATNIRRLKDKGITATLNLAINLDINHLNEKKEGKFPIEYHKIGLKDNFNNRPQTLVAAVLVLEELLDRHQKVLIHCRAGASRSVTVTCLYLVKHRDMTFQEALDFVRKHRKQANPQPGMRRLAEQVIQEGLL